MSVSVAFTKKVPAASSCRRSGHMIARFSQVINGTATEERPYAAASSTRPLVSRPALIASRNVSDSRDAGSRPVRAVGGCDDGDDPELGALVEPPLGLGGLSQAAREPDLAEGREPLAHGRAARRRGDRERHCEVGTRFLDAHAAGDVDEDVRARERDARRVARARRRSSRGAWDRRRCRHGAASRDRSARRAPAPRAGAGACPRARSRRRLRSRRHASSRRAPRDRARRRGRRRSSRRRRARSSSRSDSWSRGGCGARGSGRPRTGGRSRRGARGHAGRRRRRLSSRARRAPSRRPPPSRRGGGCPAASRTCATDPGAEPSAEAWSVCTESMTHTSGRSASSVAQTESSSVSARMSTDSAPPSRAARSDTCDADSSPVTSSARRPARAIAPSAVSRRVDFPTPGSPPTSTSDAGTSPPPRTRSSSATPVEMRSASSTRTDPMGTGFSGDGRGALGRRAVQLLDEGAEDAAARALPEPAAGGRATFGARELDGDLRHRLSLGTRSDATPSRKCADSLASRALVDKSAVRPPQTSTKGRAVWTD